MEENKNVKYSEAMAELERIVSKMQSDECDIDSLSEYTRRAMELLKVCREKLKQTDEDIRKCLESL
ncbi:MAG: exodeoxyribonuclease VII small subunit [Prevotella sp.]|nr:exodeoxyribonuclease VII small subunit [Bacteroides sp.]MCM1366184.1 exodeoxyribonuclease VII small subunit [Prevotella sp.]MCM1436936.1 exodeoxyribonuclease VII small subunit [Prevotella sp.]